MPNQRSPSFYFYMSLIGLFAVFAGFSKTFVMPVSAGTFQAPVWVYIHGALALSWVVLFFVQTFLVMKNRIQLHRKAGYSALVIAPLTVLTMIPASLFQIARDRAAFGDAAVSALLGVLTSGFFFLLAVLVAIYYRRQPQVHKRLMFLATVILLWPAWFRFRHLFPWIPRPEIWLALVLADVFIVIAWVRELYLYKRVHPVLLWGGLFIIVEQSLEVVAFDSPSWRALAMGLYRLLS